MELRFKKMLPNAITPTRGTDGSAGMDLYVAKRIVEPNRVIYESGIAVEIPKDYVGLVFMRSSVVNQNSMLLNAVGVIDSDYRGTITGKFSRKLDTHLYEVGERFAQLVIVPYIHCSLVEADELSQTDRGQGGYGSTGK